MTLNLKAPESEVREQRLGSITGYHGTLKDLAKQGCSGCLENRKRCFTTVSSCAHRHAISLLAPIKGAVVVDHGPAGCASGAIGFSVGRIRMKETLKKHFRVVSSNLQESDTVFGAVDKLKRTIQAAYDRYHPKVIYVTTSCASSIIGDDVYSVVQEMKKELGIPVGFAAVEGIKTKIWASGFDAYAHATVDTLIKDEKPQKEKLVNYVAFGPAGREYVDQIFARLGYEVNYLTGASANEDYQKAIHAVATFGQCGAQSSYLAGALEQLYGVKYFQTYLPYGGIGFERFIREVTEYFDQKELGEQIIAEEKAAYKDELEQLRSKLKGKTALVALGASYAYEYTRILRELGVEVLHTVAYHYDPRLDNQSDEIVAAAADAREFDEDVVTTVNDIQQVENYLIVKDVKPDFIVSRAHSTSTWGVKTGIPAIEARIGLQIFGYKGLVSFGHYVANELANTNFIKKLSARYQSPFTKDFENRSPYSFLEEVEQA